MFSNSPWDILIFVVSLLLSMTVHEATHAFVAYRLGDNTALEAGRVSLNPLKHVDLFTTILLPIVLIILGLPVILAARPVPFNPLRVRFGEYGAAMMAVAGPLSNLALAAIVSFAARSGVLPYSLGPIVAIFVPLNIIMFIFNMIPLPPLDGSRLLYAFAPQPIQRIMYRIETLGFIPILIILLLFMPVLDPVLSSLENSIANFLLG
jgi:Zn-dependent protease